jgi:hypothetical protein
MFILPLLLLALSNATNTPTKTPTIKPISFKPTYPILGVQIPTLSPVDSIIGGESLNICAPCVETENINIILGFVIAETTMSLYFILKEVYILWLRQYQQMSSIL